MSIKPGLEIILGCMYASKTTELLARLSKISAVDGKALYINHKLDVRNKDDAFSSHNPQLKNKLSSDRLVMVQTDDLSSIDSKLIDEANIIGVDEAHFFKSLAPVIEWIDKKQKYVVVACLNGDSNRNTFGDINLLIPHSDTISKLSAYCVNCSKQKNKTFESAIFTYKTSASKEVIDVGAMDKYISVCRSCYLQLTQKE